VFRDLLNDHDGEIFLAMSILVEMCSNWFPCPVMFDVRSVASELFLQGILCHTNILYATLTAFNQIDYTLCPAGGRCRHLVGFFGDSTAESVCSLDVWASLTASAVAWAVSSVFRDGDSKLNQ